MLEELPYASLLRITMLTLLRQVRNSWVTKPDREAAGFWDAASWEEVKKGDEAVKRWIRDTPVFCYD